MDSLGGQDVLAQRGDVHVAEHRGVERVAALLRGRSGVGRLALVLHVQLLHGDAVHPHQIGVGGVHHHRGVRPVERAVAGHLDLAAAALFGRRAHDAHAATDLVGQHGGSQAGARGRRWR